MLCIVELVVSMGGEYHRVRKGFTWCHLRRRHEETRQGDWGAVCSSGGFDLDLDFL